MTAWIVGLALLQGNPQGPPAAIEAVAAKLRKSGGEAIVANVGNGKWEIWFEFRTPASDASLRVLHDVKNLSAIRLLDGGFTDKGITFIKNLPDLEVLVLKSSDLTDACMTPISRLKSVKKLDLILAKLTSVGLTKLRAMPNLQQLYLYSARVKDADLEPLKSLQQLRLLNLPLSITDKKIEELRKSLPRTEITRI
jgi:hypothetical protein